MTDESTDSRRVERDVGAAQRVGGRVGHAASSAVTEAAFAAVGLTAYAADLVRSLGSTPQAVRTVGGLTLRGASTVGDQIARGFRTLSRRGHRVLGVAPGAQRKAAAAGANIARTASDAMLDAAAATEDTAERIRPDA